MKDQVKSYGSCDLYLTSFLKCRGCRIVDVDKSGRRITFLFQETEELKKLVKDYFNNDATAKINEFVHSLKDVKSIVFNTP